jgi:dTDP-4-amino-4,6-dideoxygalactose transaminase
MYRSLPSANAANLPTAQIAANQIICLPMSSNMSTSDAERVVSAIVEAASNA